MYYNYCIYVDILSPIIRQISKPFCKVIVMLWTKMVIEHLMKDYGWPKKYKRKQFTYASHVIGRGGPWAHLRIRRKYLDKDCFIRKVFLS